MSALSLSSFVIPALHLLRIVIFLLIRHRNMETRSSSWLSYLRQYWWLSNTLQHYYWGQSSQSWHFLVDTIKCVYCTVFFLKNIYNSTKFTRVGEIWALLLWVRRHAFPMVGFPVLYASLGELIEQWSMTAGLLFTNKMPSHGYIDFHYKPVVVVGPP